jgi:hypothetical protein
MNCHEQVQTKDAAGNLKSGLATLLDHWKRAEPIRWNKVNDLADFVYFDHSRHIAAGLTCQECHGPAGDGSGLPGQARNFTKPDGWKRSPKVADIYRTLMEGVPGTQMRPFPNLTPWERVALAHYVRSFLKGQAPQDTRPDYDALVKVYGLDKIQPPKQPLPIDQAMKLLVEDRNPPSTTPAP